MTRGSIIWGKDELTRAPAPDAKHIRRDINSASAQSGSNTPTGLCGKLRSQGLAAETMTLQTYPTAKLQVGRRGGRLSESSPAVAAWGRYSVQGELPSHSFFPSLAETVTAFGAVFALFVLLFCKL